MASSEIVSSSNTSTITSTDNGQTWKSGLAAGAAVMANRNGRIIMGSDKDLGLFYSDDGAVTWTSSNITYGCWGGITYNSDKVFATSYNGYGVAYSTDNGTTWTIIISEGNYSSVAVCDGGVVAAGERTAIMSLVPLKVASITTYGDSNTMEAGGKAFISMLNGISLDLHSHILSNDEVNADLLIILNKVIVPRLFLKLTGEPHSIDDTGYISVKSGEQRRIVRAGDDVYKSYRVTSVIDWPTDVGMQQFGTMTIADLMGTDIVEDTALNDVNDYRTNYNSTLTELIRKVGVFIKYKRSVFMEYVNNKIYSAEPDSGFTDEISEKSVSETSKNYNFTALKLLLDSQKSASSIIMSSIAESMFGFSEPMIKTLINAAVMETARSSAGPIKYGLFKINRSMVASGTTDDYTIDPNTYIFKYDFYRGLEDAFTKYIIDMTNNIRILDDDGDKALISIAADYYRQEERQSLLDQVDVILPASNFRTLDGIDVVQSDWSKMLSEARASLLGSISLSATERKAALEKVLEGRTCAYANEANTREIFNYMFRTYDMSVRSNLQEGVEFSFFDSSSNDLASFTQDEVDRAYGYLNEIHGKFLDRCSELVEYCFDNFTKYDEYISQQHIAICSELDGKVSSLESDLCSYIDAGTFGTAVEIDVYFSKLNGTIKRTYYTKGEGFINMIINSFTANEGVI